MYVMRTIKSPSSVVSATKFEHGRQTLVAINRGRAIDICDGMLNPVDTIHPNSYTTLVVSLAFREIRGLLLVNRDGEYVVTSEGSVVARGRMPQPLSYTRYVRFNRNLVFIAEDGSVAVSGVDSNGLVFDDDVNDFNYYRILDVLSRKNDLMFLLEDISGDVFLARYNTNPAKIGLVLKEKTVLKRGIRFMRTMEDGVLFLGNGRAYYYAEGRFVTESEFANPGPMSSIWTSRGAVVSMEDGEMVRVSLERSMDGGEERQALKISVVGNMGTWFNSMIHLEKDVYYCGSRAGNSYCLKMDEEVRVVREFENEVPGGLVYFGDGFKYVGRASVKEMTYRIDLPVESRHEFPKAIRRFGMFGGYYVVSYVNEGKIFGPAMIVEKSFDEILNIHIWRHCYFNTREHIFCLKDKDLAALEDKGIILSSYHEDRCVIFTEERRLKMIYLETMSQASSAACPYEVSLLYLSSYLFVSTYNNEFVVLDRMLEVVWRGEHRTLKTSCSVGSRAFFGDMEGVVYEMEVERGSKEEVRTVMLRPMCTLDSVVDVLVPVGGYIMAIGRSTVFVNPEDGSFHRCSLEGIHHSFFADQLYVARGRWILRCSFRFTPTVNIETRGVEEKGHEESRTVRFVASTSKAEVVGSVATESRINRDAVVRSYLGLRAGGGTHSVTLPNEVVMDGRYVSKHLLVVVSNLTQDSHEQSKVSMYCTRSRSIRAVYESVGEGVVHALETSGEYVATHRGRILCVYKRQAQVLVELCATRIDIMPYKIVMKANRIACGCIRRSFGMFVFNQETNHLSPDFMCTQKIQVDSMAFVGDNLVVTTTDGRILVVDSKHDIRTFVFGERITSIGCGSLSLYRNNTFYLTTENNGICVAADVEVDGRQLDVLGMAESCANDSALFSRERSDVIVDVDVINNAGDQCLSGDGYSVREISQVLDVVNRTY